MNQDIDRRHLDVRVANLRVEERDEDSDESGGVLKGTAAVFNSESRDLGGFVEVLSPGAFRSALEDSDVFALFNHDSNQILGRQSSGTLRLRETDEALEYEVDLDTDQTAQFVRRKVQRGELDGNSFSFRIAEDGDEVEEREDGTVVRTILPDGIERLLDVGPVTFPAYKDTQVSARTEQRMERVKKVEEDPEPEPVQADDEGRLDSAKRKIRLAEAEG